MKNLIAFIIFACAISANAKCENEDVKSAYADVKAKVIIGDLNPSWTAIMQCTKLRGYEVDFIINRMVLEGVIAWDSVGKKWVVRK